MFNMILTLLSSAGPSEVTCGGIGWASSPEVVVPGQPRRFKKGRNIVSLKMQFVKFLQNPWSYHMQLCGNECV